MSQKFAEMCMAECSVSSWILYEAWELSNSPQISPFFLKKSMGGMPPWGNLNMEIPNSPPPPTSHSGTAQDIGYMVRDDFLK